jgi:hypothetical protein
LTRSCSRVSNASSANSLFLTSSTAGAGEFRRRRTGGPRIQAINRTVGTDLLHRGADVEFVTNTLGVSRQWVRRRREQFSRLEPIREWHADSGFEELGQGPKTPDFLALQSGGVITKSEGKVIACLHCEAPVFVSAGKGRPRRYCDDGCRRAYHRSREAVPA